MHPLNVSNVGNVSNVQKNILKGPIIRINFENFPDCIHEYEKKFYYNLSKPISNDQKIVEINMKNKLKNEY